MPNRHDVVTTARDYLGSPWLHQGRARNGIDCAGLIILVAKDLGLSNYDTTNYQRRSYGLKFLHHFTKNMDKTPVTEAQPGDVMIFRDGNFPCHSAILGRNIRGKVTIIHAHAPSRKVVEEQLDMGEWMQRRVAAFTYRGID